MATDPPIASSDKLVNQEQIASPEKQPTTKRLRPLLALVPYLMRYKGRVILAIFALFVSAAATLAIPLALRQLIDTGFSASVAANVGGAFIALIGLAAVLASASASRYYLVVTLGERVVADIRRDVFKHLLDLSPAFFDASRSGEITSRLTADATQIKAVSGTSASVALRNLVLFTGATVMMVITSPSLSGLVLLVIPLIVLPIVAFGRAVRRKSRLAQDTLADASAYASEVIGSMRTVQAFTGEGTADSFFSRRVESAYGAARSATGARAVLTAFSIFLIFSSVVGVLWWGAQSVVAGDMTAGRLGQFVLYSIFAAGALGELSQVWGDISLAAGASERIIELLNTRSVVREPSHPVALPKPARGEIQFDRVSFAYEKSDTVISDVSLRVSPGEQIAIVGPSGAGKSTLFSLIMRFYDPTSGSIRLDGVDLQQASSRDLRERIALVPQDTAVFAISAADNIRFASPDASDDDVVRAALAARADTFLRELPDGYETIIGERGVTLSGGQRQRLAIARAILKDAPILLLDEATSALDAESEQAVQAAFETLMHGRTTLVIAHRLATIKGADRIIVMDEGRIVEDGDHASLVAREGLYARLAALQFNTGEGEIAPEPKAESFIVQSA